jgi:hypothetical protein
MAPPSPSRHPWEGPFEPRSPGAGGLVAPMLYGFSGPDSPERLRAAADYLER